MDGQANKRCKHGTWHLAHPPPHLMLPACCLLGDVAPPAPGPLARQEQEWGTCFPTTTQLLPPHCFPSSLLPFPELAQNTQGPVITQCPIPPDSPPSLALKLPTSCLPPSSQHAAPVS